MQDVLSSGTLHHPAQRNRSCPPAAKNNKIVKIKVALTGNQLECTKSKNKNGKTKREGQRGGKGKGTEEQDKEKDTAGKQRSRRKGQDKEAEHSGGEGE